MNYFDHIYVINLPRRPDRLLKVLSRLNRLDIKVEIIEGIDGALSPYVNQYKKYVYNSEFIYKNISTHRKIPNSGAWGYLKSWEKVLKDACLKGYQNFLCLDDDVIFRKDFHEKFAEFIAKIPDNWKIINLGASQHLEWTPIPNSLFYYPNHTDGSFATAVHQSIYPELLALIGPMDYPFDSGPLRTIYSRYPTQCFVAYPNLIIADVRDSVIREPRDQESMALKVGWDLSLYEDIYDPPIPKVSVILCVYNSENSIGESIRSLQLQTYPNLEIIVVDDCSTDGTVAVIKELQKKDDRIQLIQNTINAGCYTCRNMALRQCTGQMITFHDADDYSLSTRIEQQVIGLWRYRVLFTTCLICRSHITDFNFLQSIAEGKSRDFALLSKVSENRVHIKGDHYQYCCSAIVGMVTPLFTREVFEKLGLYWELRCIADAEFCERLLFHYANKAFRGEESVVTYLNQSDYIPGIYYKIPEVLYICKEMNDANITTQYKCQEKLRHTYRRNWRARLHNRFWYQYPDFRHQYQDPFQ